MMKDKSNNKIGKKWKAYITGIITSNFTPFNKIDKYFHYPISDSTTKAIQENWIRILGIDYEIICMNLCKDNQPLGIALEGRNELSRDAQEVIQRHYLRAIMPTYCIGRTQKFMTKDELLEVNGLKIVGLSTKEVLRVLKKLTNYFQIVVGRSLQQNYDLASDYGGSEDNLNSPIPFYDMDEDESSRNGTLRSVASNYSTTSRDFGSSVSFGGMIDGQYENVREYLRNMKGWRGPIIIEFFKHKESLGLALEEIPDPKSSDLIIVFKVIVPGMKAGKDGRLHAGDRLLQVNGKSVNGVPFRQVCKWIKSAPGGRLVLCICKPHFESMSFDPNNPESNDKYFYSTLRDGDKLPKLSEENDGEFNEIPNIPEYIKNHITLKRTENKLGVFLDINEGGKNGARIKKMSRGIAKSDGRLKEGDYITEICGISLRVDDKNKLDYCLKQISASTQDYSISYITSEDMDLYKSKYSTKSSQRKLSDQPTVPISNIYPDPAFIKLNETTNELDTEKVSDKPLNVLFETFYITIVNDREMHFGLVLSPSLMEPERYISITDIRENSVCDKNGLLKINDEILTVNDMDFKNIPVAKCGQLLSDIVKKESLLYFQIRRLMDCENQVVAPLVEKLTECYDLYHSLIRKGSNGYGFSLSELDYDNVVIVGKIDLSSPAYKVGNLKSGDRFAMINKCNVINCSKTTIIQLVKNSTEHLELVMEIPKYREFLVKISKDSTMSLGLNIAGGCDTLAPIPIIESLVLNRNSKFSEELISGDLIIEVDNESLVQQNHKEVIQTLRSTGPETTFKILRKLPYLKRKIFDHFELPDFPESYLQSCRYSVTINKPVDNIKSYGINFTDVVIIDQIGEFKILDRYKMVFSIEKNSLAEKYAPEIKCNDFLIAINEVPVYVDILPEDLKEIVDQNNRINLIFSKDIPYNLKEKIKDYDSPILLTKSKNEFQSDSSSVDTDSIQSNIEDHKEMTSVTQFGDSNNVQNNFITQSNDIIYKSSVTENLEVNNQNTSEEIEKSIESVEGQIRVDNKPHLIENTELTDENNSDINSEEENSTTSLPGEINCTEDKVSADNDDNKPHLIENGKENDEDTSDMKNEEIDNSPISSPTEIDNIEDNGSVDNDDNKPNFTENSEVNVENNSDINNRDIDNLTISPTDKTVSTEDKISVGNDENKTDFAENGEEIDEDTSDNNSEEDDYSTTSSSDKTDSIKDNNDNNNESTEPSSNINDQTNCDKDLEDNKNDLHDNNKPVENPTAVIDIPEIEPPIDSNNNDFVDKSSPNYVDANNLSDIGIGFNYITVNKIENVELGFQLYGGFEGGSEGETIPVFVVGVEKNTCNWPADSENPLLKTGQQVIELNGQLLSVLKLSKIQTIIKETDSELKFKVVTFK